MKQKKKNFEKFYLSKEKNKKTKMNIFEKKKKEKKKKKGEKKKKK